ncbi:hypothetical protein BDZ91DRAFT_711790 [Kalaharituber pfeilii]|nr:hypothetical protein BDZ91DRAFT_711790 [Kalaharituber pfeilii]
MHFTTTLAATLTALLTVATAIPVAQTGAGFLPLNTNDEFNQNLNVNENQNEQDQFQVHESFHSVEGVLRNFCGVDSTGSLRLLGKRSDLIIFPGFENFDFNNNQNANVNQNALLQDQFMLSSQYHPVGGDFLSGLGGGSFSDLVDCFLNDQGALVAGRR